MRLSDGNLIKGPRDGTLRAMWIVSWSEARYFPFAPSWKISMLGRLKLATFSLVAGSIAREDIGRADVEIYICIEVDASIDEQLFRQNLELLLL